MLAFVCCTYQYDAPFAVMLGVTCPTSYEAKIPRNYTMGKDPESFPVTYTASPQLKEAAMAVPTWQYWSITDCKKQLVTCSYFRLFSEQGGNADLGSWEAIVTFIHDSVTCITCVLYTSPVFNTSATSSHPPCILPTKVAVVATEETDGMRPGRCKVYNAQGQKATEAIPDALMPRLQFVPGTGSPRNIED